MEVQVQGMTSATEEFELKLRAAGASKPVQFRVVESVWLVPSTSTTVRSQVRIIHPDEDAEHDADPSATLVFEDRVIQDNAKDNYVQIVNINRIQLKGNVHEVLKGLGFEERFSVGRNGTRVDLPNGWQVEYFSLSEINPTSTNLKKRSAYVLENGSTGWLVTLKRPFRDEKESRALKIDASRLIRRLTPELRLTTWLSVLGTSTAYAKVEKKM